MQEPYLPGIETSDGKRYQCPCCGYFTLTDEPGQYDICPICFWEDDDVQFRDPTFWGGANELSLENAQRNYQEYAANSKQRKPYGRRWPTPEEIADKARYNAQRK